MKLLSIVVPAKNNYHCVESIYKKVSDMDPDIVELVISDNSPSNEEMKSLIEKYSTANIVYVHEPSPITMTENFERGIDAATGKYLCMLGADDMLTSQIIQVAEYMERNDIDSAVFKKAFYNWPQMEFRFHDFPSLTIRKSTGKIRVIDTDKELGKMQNRGMVSVGKLPGPYHGIVRRDLFEKVIRIAGRFIPGASPDMAMAVSLSQVCSKHVYIDAPITVSGHSYNSAGGKGARGAHKGDLKGKSFLPKNIEENWPGFIPKVWTAPTLYADSLVSSLSAMNMQDRLEEFNKEANYANLAVFFPEYKPLIKPHLRGVKSRVKYTGYVMYYFTARVLKFISNWLSVKLGITFNYQYRNIDDSYEASIKIEEFIEKRSLMRYFR